MFKVGMIFNGRSIIVVFNLLISFFYLFIFYFTFILVE